MNFTKQHSALSKLVFYDDIIEHFETLKEYRVFDERSRYFWHKSGTHFFLVKPLEGPKHAEVELVACNQFHFFSSTWGHVNQHNNVVTFLLSPRGPEPKLNNSIDIMPLQISAQAPESAPSKIKDILSFLR